MKFHCIAEEDTVRAFRLAGVEGSVADTPQRAAALLDEAVARPDCAIVVLSEQTAAGIREHLDAVRARCTCPLIVEIPGPTGPAKQRKTLRHLVQEAVGIHFDQPEMS